MPGIELDPLVVELSERLRRLGVKGVLFDKDDTLIYTSEIFRRFMLEYVEEVVRLTGLEKELFHGRLSKINDEEYAKMGVSPTRWEAVCVRLAEEFPSQAEAILGQLPVLMKIYQTVPRMRPGAKQILEGLRESGFRVGIVTHANRDWAEWKLAVTGLGDLVDVVVIADENGHKRKEHWGQAVESLGLEPNNCLVVGDNLKGDVIAGVLLGARAIWMPSPWSVYREGEVPEGVVTIDSLDQFWEGVLKLS